VLLVLQRITRAWRSEKAQSSGSDTGVTNAGGAELNDHQRRPELSGNLTLAEEAITYRTSPLSLLGEAVSSTKQALRSSAPRRSPILLVTSVLSAADVLWIQVQVSDA
jgi:hypothetical protein